MASNIKTIKQALDPAFLKQPTGRTEIEHFKEEFNKLFDRLDINETEEFHKNLIRDFLNAVYYKDKYYINTKERKDLVIYNDNQRDSSVGVLIETKSPKNKTEMVSYENLNVKSFQELLLYYLQERKKEKNIELRYLIITNVYEWFVFDARNFEDTFGNDKELMKKFNDFENKTSAATRTDTFYKEIATTAINRHTDKIEYTYFDIRNYKSVDDKKLIPLYKFFSLEHLLKKQVANDNNQLNKEFYAELLHIIGLEEITQDGKKLISRKKEQEREAGSIIENAISAIISADKVGNIDTQKYGQDKQERLFNVALDLAITWINRIIFLKLLESQIIKYNNGDKDFAFLSGNKLNDYLALNTLFFSVLACKEDERDSYQKDKFAHVPYLNSSLFEKTELEDNTIFISNLQNYTSIKTYSKSVLGGNQSIKPLEYLLKFLDAYNFNSEGSDEIQEENKPLISASVLGLIFEKINGYKDGSFFTPSSITMYICRETIGRAIIQQFNAMNGWNCKTIKELYNKIQEDEIEKSNKIFNSLRICDPAVGSGHFLVSALNEMIYLKSELGILTDKNGKRLKDYHITVENDELNITDNEGNYFVYNTKNIESSRVQETLFHEKQTIIENCLFGVDINPNSVKISCLRLWIELLKHTYYHSDTKKLETLPNIDINIKCGNSLMNMFALDDKYGQLKGMEEKVRETTRKYKELVFFYKQRDITKEYKQQIVKDIEKEKTSFYQINNPQDSDYQDLEKARDKLFEYTHGLNYAVQDNKRNITIVELTEEVERLEKVYNEKKRDCFEWRFEFPEVLDDNGKFIGFDAVIGNPPYIQLQKEGGKLRKLYGPKKNGKKTIPSTYQTFTATGDIYSLFYERGYYLIKPHGHLCYITSNKWMRAKYGEKTRKFFAEKTNPKMLIDLGAEVFEESTVDVNILLFSKAENENKTLACIVDKDCIKNMSLFLQQYASFCSFGSDSWVVLSPIEQSIKAKIEAIGTPLKEWDIKINYGIKTGFNEAFIISGEKRKELIKQDPKSDEIIRPILRGRNIKRYNYEFADEWLINIHNGIKEKGIKPINIKDYPAIKKHLDKYYPELEKRQDKGDTPYNLRNCAYMNDFFKQNIAWKAVGKNLAFAILDEGYFLVAPASFITSNHNYFLLGFLQSNVAKYFIYNNSDKTGAGDIMLNIQSLEKIPIPEPNKEIEKQIKKLIKAKDYDAIDKLVYEIYGLTEEEIRVIEAA